MRLENHQAMDGAWIGLLILAIFIFIVSVGAILALLFLWRRYQKRLIAYQQNQMSMSKTSFYRRAIPVHVEEYPTTGTYETQVSNA